MAHGLNAMLKRGPSGGTLGCKSDGKTGIGSRRIFAPQFKLQVLDSYRNDADCKGNQRATARKYGIHRRQIQKWLQVEGNLRNSVLKGVASNNNNNNIIANGNNNNNNTMMKINSSNSSSGSSVVTTTSSNTSGVSMSELIVGPEAVSSRKCGLAVALRSGAQSGRQQDDSSGSVVPHQHSDAVCTTETDTCHGEHGQPGDSSSVGEVVAAAAGAVLVVQQQQPSAAAAGDGGAGEDVLVDKRVPDIPAHNNNNNSNIYQQPPHQPTYEWQHYQMRRSPDTVSSTSGSCYSDLGDTSPIHQQLHVPLVGCSDGQCECTPLPLDYTIHTRTHSASQHGATRPAPHSPPALPLPVSPVPRTLSRSPPPPAVLPGPMDLSVRRAIHTAAAAAAAGTPVPVIDTLPPAPSTPPATAPHIWDLSMAGGRGGGVKRPYDDQETDTSSIATAAAAAPRNPQHVHARPVKLFKPYLDHVFDEAPDEEEVVECDVRPPGQPPVIMSTSNYDTEYFYNNNNNNGDYKMDYSVLYKEETSSSCGGGGGGAAPYYCPLLTEYYPTSGGLRYISAAGGQELITVHHHHPTPFMFSKGAINSSSSSSTAAAAAASVHSIKQRQSYSLDFKLSAIECYYRDAVCRGNQRAVASKFRIHRRQVQKWLKQEDQLRQRNETIKPIHIVR